MSVTWDVSKFLTSNFSTLLHWLNIYDISCTFFVSKLDISNSFNFEHSENK